MRTITNDAWNYTIAWVKDYCKDYIATGDDKRNIKLWNMNNGAKVSVISTDHKNGVGRILHVDNKEPYNMVLSSSNPDIKLWNIDDGSLIRTFNEHTDWVNALILLKNDTFCSGSGDKQIKIWNIHTEASIKTISAHKSYVASLLYLKDYTGEDVILTGSLGKSSKLVDIKSGLTIKAFERKEGIYKLEAISRPGKNIRIVGSYWGSKNITLWGKSN